VQASTNLVHWETVGLARVQKDGSYEFEGRQAAKHPRRFYRVVESEFIEVLREESNRSHGFENLGQW
jgi:hypothetical protein